MAGLYNGHLLEFPQIRVDCFTRPPAASRPQWTLPHPLQPHLPHRPAPPAQLYLLTHVHSDHLLGLSDSFTGHIICSPDTKRMLLKLEAEKERQLVVDGSKERPKRKYEGLKARVEGKGTKDERVVDRIEAVPHGVTKHFELGYEDGEAVKVTITLLDANHCPGSTMFLITSPRYAVLHTGDIRADHLFLQSLRRQPALGEFLVPYQNASSSFTAKKTSKQIASRQLDRIYLDTSCFLGTGDMPDKESVTRDLIDQMSVYPEHTVFFLNVWCFGWEDIVKEVARNFDTLVHVDRYKHQIFKAVRSDPFLSACTTLDHAATRFHACERRAKCPSCIKFDKDGQLVYNRDKLVVNVNMVEIKSAAWEVDKVDFLDRLGKAMLAGDKAEWPFTINIPFARHSPLPELQALTKMFRPKCLSPNTMYPQANGLDYYLLPDLFRDCLTQEGHITLCAERDAWFNAQPKYGPEYLGNMRTMQVGGMELRSDLAGGIKDEGKDLLGAFDPSGTLRQPATSGALKRGRRADAMEQMSRAGGLPKMSVGDLSSILSAVDQNGLFPGLADTLGTGKARIVVAPQGTLPAAGGGIKEDEEYDTEQESDVRSKRQKFYAAKVVANQEEPKASVTIKEEENKNKPMSIGSRGITRQATPASTSPINSKPEVKVEATSSILPSSSGSVPASSSQTRPAAKTRHRPIARFSIDKEHLRAYARAAAEVDDL